MGVQTMIPNLVVAQRVIDKMTAAASQFMDDETGEALIGLIMPGGQPGGVPTIYVLDTIPPDETAVRDYYTFQQGDERQYEIFTWLVDNWENQREKRRKSFGSAALAKWDAPLQHLGDWHKQPGFMIAPSGGDLMSALEQLDDRENQQEFLLAPIVTLGHPATTDTGADVNFITIPRGDGTVMRVDFWFIHRSGRMFQPIRPVVYPDAQLPSLTRYPWHLQNEDRAAAELAQLQGDKLFVSLLLWDADEQPPLEVCFLMARQGADRMLLVITKADYPDTPPSARIGPFVRMGAADHIYDVFEQVWQQSRPVPDPAGWKWTKDTYLVDYVHAVEQALGMRAADREKSSAPDASPETQETEETS